MFTLDECTAAVAGARGARSTSRWQASQYE
jgi:hypothetical protein